MTEKRKTAGELSIKAASDTSKYDSLEVGHALCDDIPKQIEECINSHKDVIDGRYFCVVMLLASDCLLKNVLRRKFYAWPFLPKPRPRQAVFLYDKMLNSVKRLWVLPDAFTMAGLSTLVSVDPAFRSMREWSMAAYDGNFHELVRKQNNIELETESEFVARMKLKNPLGEDTLPFGAEEFDFSNVQFQKLENTSDTIAK